jgi:hypothetical protein
MAFGPVSNTHFDSDPTIGIWVMGIAVPLLIWFFVNDRRRSRALSKGVEERGWQWMWEAVPYYFPERHLLNDSRPLEISNAFAGSVRGTEFISCDCTLGEGKGKKHLTLIGARSQSDPFGVRKFDLSVDSTNVEGWFGLTLTEPSWLRGRMMPAEQIFSIIESIA